MTCRSSSVTRREVSSAFQRACRMTPSRDQLNAFTLTFLSYAVLSGCRAPMSVSKSVMRGSPRDVRDSIASDVGFHNTD